jgi:hypothetical protein
MNKLSKLFITIVAICAMILSFLCVYKYYSDMNSSYVEIVCSVMFFLCGVISLHARAYCKD